MLNAANAAIAQMRAPPNRTDRIRPAPPFLISPTNRTNAAAHVGAPAKAASRTARSNERDQARNWARRRGNFSGWSATLSAWSAILPRRVENTFSREATPESMKIGVRAS
jgi:hypothetical protein